MTESSSQTPYSPELADLIDAFAYLDDWEERYRYLIELGRDLPALSEAEHSDANKVRGCVSQVWMVADRIEGEPPRLTIRADSDAHIVRGLIAVLLAAYSGRSAEQILQTDIEAAFATLGLTEHLSPNRRNGFFAMVERIRSEAAALSRAA